MKGCNIAEMMHVVNLLPPIDVDTASGVTHSEIFSMKNYAHATIIVQLGVTPADGGNITVEECDDFVPTNSTAIAFSYYGETTALGDTLGARTAAVAETGIDVSANDNIMYVIEIDASQLSAGYPNLCIVWSNPGGSLIASAVAILSGSRYAGDQSATAIA
jgi:hypothetical protein